MVNGGWIVPMTVNVGEQNLVLPAAEIVHLDAQLGSMGRCVQRLALLIVKIPFAKTVQVNVMSVLKVT